MSETTAGSTHEKKPIIASRPRKRLPRIMFVVTILVAIAIFLCQRVVLFELEEMLGIGKDIINLITYIVIMLTFIAWFLTIAFFSGWTLKYRMLGLLGLVALPAIFIALGPINDGDVGFARFEPFWISKPELNEEKNSSEVDLSRESMFDFPRFLGPEQHARSSFVELQADQFEAATLKWRQPIGKGWSGFVARNGYAVTMEQRDEFECVTCYSVETGELEWIYKHRARHQDAMNLGRVGPRATPTIYQGRVYSMGANGNLACLNGNDGSVVWENDLNAILGIKLGSTTDRYGLKVEWEENTSLAWGRSGSPLILGQENLVVVPGGGPKTDGQEPTTLLAFNLSSGELAWKGGREMIAYGSPVLETVAGVRQILLVGEDKVMGFNPEDGSLYWSHPRPGASDAAANCSQATVVSDYFVLTSKGYPDGGGELIGLELVEDLPDHAEDRLVPKSVWKSSRVLKTKFTNPVIYDGHAYSISNGYLECTNLAEGARIWKHRKRLKNGQILKVGNYILTHSEDGKLHLVQPDPSGYHELGSFDTVKGICWNTLCVYGNLVLVRSELEAACFEIPANSVELNP